MQFTKRKNNRLKKRLILIGAFAALIAALTVAAVLLSRVEPEPEPTAPKTLESIIEGVEGRYNTYAIAYPAVTESDIRNILIENEDEDGNPRKYLVARPDKTGSFRFVYYDENDEPHIYYPDILIEEEDFVYDDLYAAVTGDGYDMIPMLTYLLTAIRTPYFDDRIYLNDDPAKRNEQLAVYGLSADGDETDGAPSTKITFDYYDENGELKTHKIELGSNTITGSGYYYRVDDRDYIYVTLELNYFQYAFIGLETFVNPILVAAGLDGNQHALYAPYLTPSYRQWLNEVYDSKKNPAPFPTDGEELKSITKIVSDVSSYMPSFDRSGETDITDSYIKTDVGEYLFSVSEYEDNAFYPYFLSAIAGKEMSDIAFSQSFLYEKQAKDGSEHLYKIKKIEGVITEAGDRYSGAVGESRYVKVLYELYIDGKQENTVYNAVTGEDGKENVETLYVPYHGIIDLEAIGEADAAKIRALSVGDEPEDLEITVKYQAKNADGSETGLSKVEARFYLDEVLAIYEYVYDSEGNITGSKQLSKLTDDAVVIYRYYYTMNGVVQTAKEGVIDMKASKDEESPEQMQKIRTAIRQMLSLDSTDSISVYSELIFDNVMSDYITYDFSNVRAYVTSDLVIGFGFVNASERDPFYGESFYEKHEDADMLYAINQSSCETVVKLLGGIAETSKAEGLVGMETVEVGITHDKLMKYGCYGKSFLFSLPRDMYVSNETADDELDDMSWMRTLDFMLYISDPVNDPETGVRVRYVASEMYDIIVKIESDSIGFLDLDAVDFWARRSLILVNSEDLDTINLRFNMSDLKGEYKFSLNHSTLWIDSITGKGYFDSNRPETGSFTPYDWINVDVTQYGPTTVETAFENYLKTVGKWNEDPTVGSAADLSDFYDYIEGAPVTMDKDTKGTGMFKNLILLLYYTQYMDTLTEEEQAAALDSDGDGVTDEPLMYFDVKLNDTDPNAKSNRKYCYEFYRCDDRRVMVRIYEMENGKVINGAYASDFYISILAYRKIVSGFVSLLNGKTVDAEEPYPDYMI